MATPRPTYLEPTQEAGRRFVMRAIDGPVVMLNLLRFLDLADYSCSPQRAPPEPISGAQAFDLYIRHTLPFLRESGGELTFLGAGGPLLIGPDDESWDLAMLVRQSSAAAFLAFADHADYRAGLGHRAAALSDSRLLPLVERPFRLGQSSIKAAATGTAQCGTTAGAAMSEPTAREFAPAYFLAAATPRDRPAMAQLWVETWAKTMPDIDFVARLPWLDSHLDTLAAGGALIHVAREGGENGPVAGFVVIHPGTGYLDQLAVAPRVWGKGAAEALMAEARRLSPALVALDVNQDNPRAVRFYEKMGLAIVSEGANPMSGRLTYRMEWRGA